MNRVLRWVAALVCLAASACYSYAPVQLAEVTPGTQARARITAEEVARVSQSLGRPDRLLEGEVLETGPDRLLLAVPVTTGGGGLTQRQYHQRIELSRAGLVELEQRRFSAWKTGLVIGAGAILAGAAIGAAFAAINDSEGNEKPGPERIVVPLFRF
jgi:hypothetical protein